MPLLTTKYEKIVSLECLIWFQILASNHGVDLILKGAGGTNLTVYQPYSGGQGHLNLRQNAND